jgi:hypothetical protein
MTPLLAAALAECPVPSYLFSWPTLVYAPAMKADLLVKTLYAPAGLSPVHHSERWLHSTHG